MKDWLLIYWLGWENQEAQSQGVMITVVRSLAATPLQANWLRPTILKISVMVTDSICGNLPINPPGETIS